MNIFSVKYAVFLNWKRRWEAKTPRLAAGIEGMLITFGFLIFITLISPDAVFSREGVVSCLLVSAVIGAIFSVLLGLHRAQRRNR